MHRTINKNSSNKMHSSLVNRDPRWEEYWTMVDAADRNERRMEAFNNSGDYNYDDDYDK